MIEDIKKIILDYVIGDKKYWKNKFRDALFIIDKMDWVYRKLYYSKN